MTANRTKRKRNSFRPLSICCLLFCCETCFCNRIDRQCRRLIVYIGMNREKTKAKTLKKKQNILLLIGHRSTTKIDHELNVCAGRALTQKSQYTNELSQRAKMRSEAVPPVSRHIGIVRYKVTIQIKKIVENDGGAEDESEKKGRQN